MRYDAAIIGAGGDGLAAGVVLARAGLKVCVVERGAAPGGILRAQEFHPGFRASPFCDGVSPVPPSIFRDLGLAQAGAMIAAPPASVALWPDAKSIITCNHGADVRAFFDEAATRRDALLARAGADAAAVPPRFSILHREKPQRWPSEDWTLASLAGCARAHAGESPLAAHAVAAGFGARAGDPFLAGSALQLLLPGEHDVLPGGPARLGESLTALAAAAGAEIRCGVEIAAIRRTKARATGLVLADGGEIEARAVISTLDLKQTFLSLFAWSDLPEPLVKRVGHFRMGTSCARVLFALDVPPALAPEIRLSPIHVMPDATAMAAAYASARAGLIPERPPATLRLVSAFDPALAPVGKAAMSVTLAAIPFRLFDGAWTHEKRDILLDRARAAADAALPGVAARIVAAQIIAPPDIEDALGATQGDLFGGEIASDQMLGLRPFADCAAPRTPVEGLYLAGPSTMAGVLASCASGVFAARALMADFAAGRLK